jgi:MoaA/NifB/PqqE/SkfB family radical SAM enzyme
MNRDSKLYCNWADRGLALHNSGGALLCCHSRTFLKDSNNQQIFWHTHTLDDAWSSTTRKEIQNALESGVQHPNCNACWDVENTGGQSRRQSHSSHVIDYSNTVDSPLLLDLKLGNVCNLSCRSCNPYVSSKWVKDWWLTVDSKKEDNPYPTFNEYSTEKFGSWRLSYSDDNTTFWNKLREWLPHAQYIDIYGAEPMLIHKLFDILEYSIAQGYNKKQHLHFNTNCTIWNQRYIDILTKFKKVFFDLSIDGLYNHYDYIRNGETWEVVLENISRYDQYRKQYLINPVSICITVSFFNIYYIDEVFEYFEQRGWLVHFNMAHLPQHINLKIIPQPVKQAIREKLLRSTSHKFLQEVASILTYMDETLEPNAWDYEKSLWSELVRITTELDVIREQNFAHTFPEFYNLVSPFWIQE